jgi:hypothetical protein
VIIKGGPTIFVLKMCKDAFEGGESAEINDDRVCVQYYPDILSRESILREHVRLGAGSEKNDRPGNLFKRFVNRLAESNTTTFGTQALDCCKLNSNESPGP